MTLDATALKRLSALLDSAIDLDHDGREKWLAELPADAQNFAPSLRRMLERHASMRTDDFIDRPVAFELPAAAHDATEGLAAGGTVGGYRLLKLLGTGGMGEVWLAERADGSLTRRVALKLPMLSVSRHVIVQRFARERDILASLEHPNIARLYDAGLADDGQPYLALEYVEGQTITEHAQAQQLGLRQRVQLLIQVAAAVQHAHAHLVIHRDLKPGNVLVRHDGQAMLLDFGIAKLVEGDDAAAVDSDLTRLGGRALTLAYAAPEQVNGAPVSTATDVYALAALLYELVSGRRPFEGTRRQVEDAILTREPSRPEGVPSDLATVLLKALKKLPAERYATAAAFSDDLSRWLAGDPVSALPDSSAYRLRKFVGRHRAGVLAGSVLLVAVLASAGVATWQAVQARQQAARAASELARQQAVRNMMVDNTQRIAALAASDPAAIARPGAVAGVLQAVLRETLERLAGRPPGVQQAVLEATMLQLNYTNNFEASLDVGFQYLAHMQLHGADAAQVIDGFSSVGRNLWQLQRYDEAEAVRRAGAQWAPGATDARSAGARLAIRTDLGSVLSQQGKRQQAVAVLREAEADAARLVPNDIRRPVNRLRLANVLQGFDDAAALGEARAAHAGLLAHGEADDDDRSLGLRTLAAALMATGAAAEAEPLLRQDLALRIQTHGRGHAQVVAAVSRLSLALAGAGRADDARRLLADQLAALPAPPAAPVLRALLRGRQLAVEWRAGNVEAALSFQALDFAALAAPALQRDSLLVLLVEVRALALAGRGAEALARAQRVQAGSRDRGRATRARLDIDTALATAQLAAGDHAGAATTAAALMALLRTERATGGWAWREASETAALALAARGDPAGGAALLEAADAEAARAPLAPGTMERAESSLRRATLWRDAGRPDAARRAACEALAALEGQHPASPRLVTATRLCG